MKLLKLCVALVITLVFIQCAEEDEIIDSSGLNQIESYAAFELITDQKFLDEIAGFGFNTVDFPVFKEGDNFIVEGDISIAPDYLKALRTMGRSQQAMFFNRVDCDEIKYISVYNNLPVGSPRNSVSVAMRHWNEIPQSDIRFENTGFIEKADIIISDGPLPRGAVGRATSPSGGRPGKYIRIDISQFTNFSYAQWRSTIEHELGHCIGFAHTNGSGANGLIPFVEFSIPGTPATDPNSLMNGRRGGTVRMLTAGDQLAAQILYDIDRPDRICR